MNLSNIFLLVQLQDIIEVSNLQEKKGISLSIELHFKGASRFVGGVFVFGDNKSMRPLTRITK